MTCIDRFAERYNKEEFRLIMMSIVEYELARINSQDDQALHIANISNLMAQWANVERKKA